MIITSENTIRFLSVAEHLQRKAVVYQDRETTVYLYPNKQHPFVIQPGQEDATSTYIDMFALRFGQKEQLWRKVGEGRVLIHVGCSRAERDAMLYLPLEELVEHPLRCCEDSSCQYWSPPTGVKGRYAFSCILMRYRAIGVFDQKVGLTLEEVGRIYGCSRERIRQIQERALNRMRHHVRIEKLSVFHDRVLDYRDYGRESSLQAST